MRVGLGVALLASVGCGQSQDPAGATMTFPGPYATITVSTLGGRIELVAGGGDAVEVEFLPSSSDTWSHVDEAGNLTLVATCLGDDVVGCQGGFVLTVPADQEVTAKTGEGQLAFTGALGGVLDGQTASGAIEADGLGAADLALLTGTGPVEVAFVEVPESVSIDTGSSAVALGVPAGGYALDTDTGGTETVDPAVTADPMGPQLRVHSGTGGIAITVE